MQEPSNLAQPRVGADYFLNRAKTLVAREVSSWERTERKFSEEDFFITWFSKTLQNWKALIGSHSLRDLYFEVTYNGDLNVAYVDTYQKIDNTAYNDD